MCERLGKMSDLVETMSGMKVNDFMLQLAKSMIEKRKISDSTATQYLQTLFKLNKSKPFTNLAWTRKYEDVQAVINTYAPSTQGNQYMVLASALSMVSDKPTYRAPYNHWKGKMMEAREEAKKTPTTEKSEKQEENWMTWEDVEEKKKSIGEDLSSFISSKHITPAQYDTLLQYTVLSLYTDIQPRRNQDYLDMWVVQRLPKTQDPDRNYYDLKTQTFVFNKYKTAKKYGQQTESVPEPLQKTLALLFAHHPSSKQKEFKLLVKFDGTPMTTVNVITRLLNRALGKKVGASMLRHIFLTSKYGNITEQMAKDAEAMGHSVAMQKDYIKE